MSGTMMIIKPPADVGKTCSIEYVSLETCTLDPLRDAVGGSVELVPYFTLIKLDGKCHKCVAFCNEDGKALGLGRNTLADLLWMMARAVDHVSEYPDCLVGPVVVLYGDETFMESI